MKNEDCRQKKSQKREMRIRIWGVWERRKWGDEGFGEKGEEENVEKGERICNFIEPVNGLLRASNYSALNVSPTTPTISKHFTGWKTPVRRISLRIQSSPSCKKCLPHNIMAPNLHLTAFFFRDCATNYLVCCAKPSCAMKIFVT